MIQQPALKENYIDKTFEQKNFPLEDVIIPQKLSWYCDGRSDDMRDGSKIHYGTGNCIRVASYTCPCLLHRTPGKIDIEYTQVC